MVPDGEQQEMVKPKANWELIRVVVSLIFLVIGLVFEKAGGASYFFIPLYIVAVLMGGWGNFRKAIYSIPRLDFNMGVLMSVDCKFRA